MNLYIVELRFMSYLTCQIFLHMTFANFLGLGLTSIILPPFTLYLYHEKYYLTTLDCCAGVMWT